MHWNSRTDQHVASVNFSERQQFLPQGSPQGSTSYVYAQSQQAPLPAQNGSDYPSKTQEDCLYPKLSQVTPMMLHDFSGALNKLPPLTRSSDGPINKSSNTVCSENANPQNGQLVGIMKEPLGYHSVSAVSFLPSYNSSQVVLQSQTSNGNVQMHRAPSHQFRVETNTDHEWQQANLPGMVSDTSSNLTSSNNMRLVWVPHQHQPVGQQFPTQSTPIRAINTHLESQQRAGIPNAPGQNKFGILQPRSPYPSAPTTHMLQNKPASQQCAAIVLPQPVTMQLHSHQNANPKVTISPRQSQRPIIYPQVQQLYTSTDTNLNQHNLYPLDCLSNSSSQPVQCQPPSRTQPLKVQNQLLLDEPKIPNLNATDKDSKIAQMSPCEPSKHAETVTSFKRCFVSERQTLTDVGILRNMCRNGQETQTSGLAPGEAFPATLNTSPPEGGNSVCGVELSSPDNGSDQPVNFTVSIKDTPILTEDDMHREVQILLQSKENFLNQVKDFMVKRKLYKSLKCNNAPPSNVKCSSAANKLDCIQEAQIVPKIPARVASLPSLPLQLTDILADHQNVDQHKIVKETNVCTDSTASNQSNIQDKIASQKLAQNPELITYSPDKKQNLMFNKASPQLKEMTMGNQSYSKLSDANTTVQTLSQEQIIVSPSIKKDRSPVLAELITETINSYSKLTETQSCLTNSVEGLNNAIHPNESDPFCNKTNMPCTNLHASASDSVSTCTAAHLKEGTVMNSLTEEESCQLGNNLTEVLKSCIGMWKVPNSVRKMESNSLPNTNKNLKQALSTTGFCDQNGLTQKNVQQTSSKAETSINMNDSHHTVVVSSSTMVKASEPQIAIVNPLVLFKSKSTNADQENECRSIESSQVNQEGSISRVLGNVSTIGVSSGSRNPPPAQLHPMFDEKVSDTPLVCGVDSCEMVTISGSSSSVNGNQTESVHSLQTEKIRKCPSRPDHPKSTDVLCNEHEKHMPFKAQPNRTCEERSLPGEKLNLNRSSVCIEDAVDDQLRISSFCTLVEGNVLYDSQIAEMFDGEISTSCKTSQAENVDMPILLESIGPNTTQASPVAQQRLTDQPLLNPFSEETNEHHSFGSGKVLKMSEDNPDLAQTCPDFCNKEMQSVHPYVTSDAEGGHFRKNDPKECVSLTAIEICIPNLETQPQIDHNINVQKDCVITGNCLEDDTLKRLTAQCLNDQLSAVPLKHMLKCKANVETQTPSDQDSYSEKENCIPVDYLEDDNLDILSAQCLNDQLSELQKEFPYGLEQFESMHSLKNSLVNQKDLSERGCVEACLHSTNCNDSSSDIYCPIKDNCTNCVKEHYVSESKPMTSRQSNEHSDSNEPCNLNDDGSDPSQLKYLQLDDGSISSIDVCDSDKDDFAKQIKITVLDSEQMIKFFPDTATKCVTNISAECSQQNMQSEKRKDSPTKPYSGKDSNIFQTDAEEDCLSSNKKLFCCLYCWLSSDYGSAPKCSCVPGSKIDDAANNLECKETDAKVVDNTTSGNGVIIDLSTQSSDEGDNLTIEHQNRKRQNSFVTSNDVQQIKTSPINTKNRCDEQNLDQPLHVAQSEIKLISLQEKDLLAQPAVPNLSGKTSIDLNLKDQCKESLHFSDSVLDATSKNDKVEERGGKFDKLSVSPKSKKERLIVKTDFLKSKKRAAVRQDLINIKILNDTSDEELHKKRSKQNGKPFKRKSRHKKLHLAFSSNKDRCSNNTNIRRDSFLPQTPLLIAATKNTVGHDWVGKFHLSDASDEENEEIGSIESAFSQVPSEEQLGLEAGASVIPRPKLTHVVKVPSKKRFPGKQTCFETIVHQSATIKNSDFTLSSKCCAENVLIKNTLTIQERFQHVRAVENALKGEETKKTKAIPSVQNGNLLNLDELKKSATSFEENLSSENMKLVLPENRGTPPNSMTQKSYQIAHTSKQKVNSFSFEELNSSTLHDGSVRRLDSNLSIANENVNAKGQSANGSKVHYLNRVGFTSASSERIHLTKLELGISPSKGGGRQLSKPFEVTTVKKPLRVAVSQNIAEKSQMLVFKLCPEVLLGCSSVDEPSTNHMLLDKAKSPAEGIRSRKEDWLKNIPLKKRKVDMTKFQAESPLLDSPICVSNTSPAEVAKPPAPGSKATFHAYKQLYLEKRSKSLNLTSGK